MEGSAPAKKRGPEAGLADSEIMTILVLYHSSHFKNFKTFYQGGNCSTHPVVQCIDMVELLRRQPK